MRVLEADIVALVQVKLHLLEMIASKYLAPTMAHSALRFGETFDTVLRPGLGGGAVSLINSARSTW